MMEKAEAALTAGEQADAKASAGAGATVAADPSEVNGLLL